ncbi:MAG TPA: VOC family protein [Polyangiaceae bacterium]
MGSVPEGWTRISSSLTYDNASEAIDFLCKAFGFEVRLRVDVPGGKVAHSELVVDGGMVMVGDKVGDDGNKKEGRDWSITPKQAGGCTQALMMFVDDLDAHLTRARAAGATIASEPKVSDYGDDYWIDRSYEAIDIGGHHWWFCQRLATKGKKA